MATLIASLPPFQELVNKSHTERVCEVHHFNELCWVNEIIGKHHGGVNNAKSPCSRLHAFSWEKRQYAIIPYLMLESPGIEFLHYKGRLMSAKAPEVLTPTRMMEAIVDPVMPCIANLVRRSRTFDVTLSTISLLAKILAATFGNDVWHRKVLRILKAVEAKCLHGVKLLHVFIKYHQDNCKCLRSIAMNVVDKIGRRAR
jgi:hypothetical protein